MCAANAERTNDRRLATSDSVFNDNSLVPVVRRHIGKDHAISYLKTVGYLDSVNGTFAESYFDFLGVLSVRIDFEERPGSRAGAYGTNVRMHSVL